MEDEKLFTINQICNSDRSENYREEMVPVSSECNLIGTRSVNVSKSFSHAITLRKGDVITIIKDANGYFHLVDADGNYDFAWRLNQHFALDNVKFSQGLIVRGTLLNTDFYGNKKYCKPLKTNADKFFTHRGIPVMSVQSLLVDSNGDLYARGIK